ncbi:MAG: hypothetical protein AB7N65_12795 [Vicinamibacterales bacterium]
MMVWFGRMALVLLAGVAGFLVGGRIGAATVPADAGLAGGATVFLWAIAGTLVAIVAAVVGLRRRSRGGRR